MKKKYKLSLGINPPISVSVIHRDYSMNNPERKDEEGKSEDADFETAISATGLGKFNLAVYILMFCSASASIFDTTSISYVLPAAECDLGLSLSDKGLLNAMTYIGMISTAFVWGYLADTLGRKKLIIFGHLIDGTFVLLCGFSQNFPMLLFSKFMAGCMINGPFAALISYISEFHSKKYRTTMNLLLGIIFSIATVALPALAWLILPLEISITVNESFRLHSWNVFLFICALPSLLSCSICTFMPESAKFLMTMGRNEEALETFKLIYSINTGKPKDAYPIKTLINERRQDTDSSKLGHIKANRSTIEALKGGWKQIVPLFLPPHVVRIVLVFLMQFGVMLGLNSLRLWIPQLFTIINDYKAFNPEEDASLCKMLEMVKPERNISSDNATEILECFFNTDNTAVYTNSMIVAAATVAGFTSAAFLVNYFGKNLLYAFVGASAGICGLCMYFARNEATVTTLSSVFIALGTICPTLTTTILVDLVPTQLRTMSISLTMMFGRIGAMSGNIVFPMLLAMGCLEPFLMVGIFLMGCSLIALLLPKTDKKNLE